MSGETEGRRVVMALACHEPSPTLIAPNWAGKHIQRAPPLTR